MMVCGTLLDSQIVALLDNTNSALLLAIKIESVNPESVQRRTRTANAMAKIRFSVIKPIAGDHKFKPAIKIVAKVRATIPLRVKQEFMISTGFSALGRKRIRAEPKPNLLSMARRDIADMIAAPKPTSASV